MMQRTAQNNNQQGQKLQEALTINNRNTMDCREKRNKEQQQWSEVIRDTKQSQKRTNETAVLQPSAVVKIRMYNSTMNVYCCNQKIALCRTE
jgi:hypothetical protein